MRRTALWIILTLSVGFGQNFKLANLKNTEIECDFLIVCKSMFEQRANAHAKYRVDNILDEVDKPAIALLEDIYATFPDSSSQEGKLNQFLRYTSEQWREQPQFILLVGEPPSYGESETAYSCPSYFFAENSHSVTNYVPVDDRLLKSEPNQTCFAALGRLPVRTEDEYSTILQKIEQFETNMDFGSISTLSLYDDDMMGSECNFLNFYEPSFNIESRKASFVPNTCIQMIESDADAEYRKRFLEDTIAYYINRGASTVSYYGMGGKNVWSDEAVLIPDSILKKIDNGQSSIFLSFTSNSNRFQQRDSSIGTKLLLSPNKGAVAAIGASNNGQYTSSLERFQNIVWSNYTKINTLGELLYNAKAKTYSSSLEKMCLLGDPCLMISIDTINFSSHDTIAVNSGSSIQISGSIPTPSIGNVRVFRYSMPEIFEKNTTCKTNVNHYRSPSIIDTTDIQLVAGNFTQNLNVGFDIDSVIPVKLIYFTAIEGKKYYGSIFVIEGKSSNLAGTPMPHKYASEQYQIQKGVNGFTLRNIGFNGTLEVFDPNGRILYSAQVQNGRDLVLKNIQRGGMLLIRTTSKDGIFIKKISLM